MVSRLVMRIALPLWLVSSVACFRGGDREKEAPAGFPGGLCLAPQPPAAPDPFCEEGQCNSMRNYCYDASDPCEGFFCGGSERGVCTPNANFEPSCTCHPGFNNQRYDLYCCPDSGTTIMDPRCATATPSGAQSAGDPEDMDDEGESSGTG